MDIEKIISEMSLEEKASLCTGRNFWQLQELKRFDVPSIMMTDGPHGLRKQSVSSDHLGISQSNRATCFPTASLLAATWDRDLIEILGSAIADECLGENVSVLLGPGINIKRSPLGGRNFEYFSEDPYLTAELGIAYVKGVQSKGVGTSLKHFALNNQETRRMTIDTIVDKRTMREIYLYAFERVIKEASPYTVMCSYNKLLGEYCSEHKELLDKILRDEWGYEGLVVSDWGAVNDRAKAIMNGLDLEMPGPSLENRDFIIEAVKGNLLPIEALDKATARVLNLINKTKHVLSSDLKTDMEKQHQLARKIASEGVVLLKNDDSILPLANKSKVALVGEFAKRPRYQGNGSSLINPFKLSNLHDAFAESYSEGEFRYARGYNIDSCGDDEALIAEAIGIAKESEIVVVCIGLTEEYESEGFDRSHMDVPTSHNNLVDRLVEVNPNIVVVLSNGAPVSMPWIKNVKACVEAYLGGQAGALGLFDVLTGKVNPSGKLAETFPIGLEDTPSYDDFPGDKERVLYREGLYIGYRHYITNEVEMLFPFGHGLSYTDFAYKDLTIDNSIDESKTIVRFKLKNKGMLYGKEVAQVYVSKLDRGIPRPKLELKGFDKIELESKEEKEVIIELDEKCFCYFDIPTNSWKKDCGRYEILVGSSSTDIRLRHQIDVISSHVPTIGAMNIGKIFDSKPSSSKDDFDLNSTVEDISHLLIGKVILFAIGKGIKSMIGDDASRGMMEMYKHTAIQSPLRSLVLFSQGKLNRRKVEGIVDIANKKRLKGIWKLIT